MLVSSQSRQQALCLHPYQRPEWHRRGAPARCRSARLRLTEPHADHRCSAAAVHLGSHRSPQGPTRLARNRLGLAHQRSTRRPERPHRPDGTAPRGREGRRCHGLVAAPVRRTSQRASQCHWTTGCHTTPHCMPTVCILPTILFRVIIMLLTPCSLSHSSSGHRNIVRTLVLAGADDSILDYAGKSPLETASYGMDIVLEDAQVGTASWLPLPLPLPLLLLLSCLEALVND